jgi:hypothetical protein
MILPAEHGRDVSTHIHYKRGKRDFGLNTYTFFAMPPPPDGSHGQNRLFSAGIAP